MFQSQEKIMTLCSKCKKQAIVMVGKDNTPLCEKHYIMINKYLHKITRKLIERFGS